MGAFCGGIIGATCSASLYCDFPDNSCGAADASGMCAERPAACPANIDPVCACNGMVYSNECGAQAAGSDVNAYGGCTPPTGKFECGWRFCTQGADWCESITGGAIDSPGQFNCQALPSSCGANPTCACIQMPVGCQCSQTTAGDITVRCFAP